MPKRSKRTIKNPRRTLALLIPAHNEEMVLDATITSAVRAGMSRDDIYVVDDNSKDLTAFIARVMLGKDNVLSVPQSGKAGALDKALKHFKIADRYVWVHFADADSVFGKTYFKELQDRLTTDYVAATGHIQSLHGGWISKYRLYEYTIGLEVLRRIQFFFDVIPVIPGPTSIFRTDILPELDFTVHSLTEDMDITLQIHRKHLGKILYIPQAKTYTQDPKDFKDYFVQISRWYRGNFQSMERHHVGRKFQRIDAYFGYVMLEQWLYLVELMFLPALAWWFNSYVAISTAFLTDLATFLGFTIWAAVLNKRYDVIGAFPLFYLLRFVNLYVFVKSWYEVVVRKKFQQAQPGWDTAGRRYQIAANALSK
jgi:biofilm PGA synthesis N-glycosyltransferase PgaC